MTSPRDIPGLHEVDYHGWTGEEIRKLRQEYPDWDFWYVANYMASGTWCGKPKDKDIAVINRDDIASFRQALQAVLNPVAVEADEYAERAMVLGLRVVKRERKAQS